MATLKNAAVSFSTWEGCNKQKCGPRLGLFLEKNNGKINSAPCAPPERLIKVTFWPYTGGTALKMMELLWIYKESFLAEAFFIGFSIKTPWLRTNFSGGTGGQMGLCSCCPLSPMLPIPNHCPCQASTGLTESGE